jgi:hypothetical protein
MQKGKKEKGMSMLLDSPVTLSPFSFFLFAYRAP